jgi:hypothetical protein
LIEGSLNSVHDDKFPDYLKINNLSKIQISIIRWCEDLHTFIDIAVELPMSVFKTEEPIPSTS